MLRLVPIFFVLLLALPSDARSNPPSESAEPDSGSQPRTVYKATTEIDIEDVRVDADTTKPHGATVLERRAQGWTPLLTPRTSFDAEMLESVTAIR